MELIERFGINGYTLLAQTVNFLIVLFVLWKFAYKPVLKMLRDRSKTIEKGLKDAEKAQEALENAQNTKTDVLSKAQKEASELITNARKDSEELKRTMLAETKTQIAALQESAAQELQLRKEQLVNDAKNDIADLVVTATAKILKTKVTEETHRKDIFDAITNMSPRQ